MGCFNASYINDNKRNTFRRLKEMFSVRKINLKKKVNETQTFFAQNGTNQPYMVWKRGLETEVRMLKLKATITRNMQSQKGTLK